LKKIGCVYFLSGSHFIDFFEKKVQENSNSHLEAEIEDEIMNKGKLKGLYFISSFV
jgi:hypothetical protein